MVDGPWSTVDRLIHMAHIVQIKHITAFALLVSLVLAEGVQVVAHIASKHIGYIGYGLSVIQNAGGHACPVS